jgi:hypothetical protein
MDLIIHEVAHNVDFAVTDMAYRHSAGQTTWGQLTRQQAVDNADSYSEFAKGLVLSSPGLLPFQLSLSTGALLSAGRPLWAVRARAGLRSRTGLEVFDLVGGVNFFFGLDPSPGPDEPVIREIGLGVDLGVLSRSADTHFFADTRVGAFYMEEQVWASNERGGISISALIGWADNGFRTGVDMTMLFDLLSDNHALLIGGTFGLEF